MVRTDRNKYILTEEPSNGKEYHTSQYQHAEYDFLKRLQQEFSLNIAVDTPIVDTRTKRRPAKFPFNLSYFLGADEQIREKEAYFAQKRRYLRFVDLPFSENRKLFYINILLFILQQRIFSQIEYWKSNHKSKINTQVKNFEKMKWCDFTVQNLEYEMFFFHSLAIANLFNSICSIVSLFEVRHFQSVHDIIIHSIQDKTGQNCIKTVHDFLRVFNLNSLHPQVDYLLRSQAIKNGSYMHLYDNGSVDTPQQINDAIKKNISIIAKYNNKSHKYKTVSPVKDDLMYWTTKQNKNGLDTCKYRHNESLKDFNMYKTTFEEINTDEDVFGLRVRFPNYDDIVCVDEYKANEFMVGDVISGRDVYVDENGTLASISHKSPTVDDLPELNFQVHPCV